VSSQPFSQVGAALFSSRVYICPLGKGYRNLTRLLRSNRCNFCLVTGKHPDTWLTNLLSLPLRMDWTPLRCFMLCRILCFCIFLGTNRLRPVVLCVAFTLSWPSAGLILFALSFFALTWNLSCRYSPQCSAMSTDSIR
jgi:hypothetical protein